MSVRCVVCGERIPPGSDSHLYKKLMRDVDGSLVFGIVGWEHRACWSHRMNMMGIYGGLLMLAILAGVALFVSRCMGWP